MRGPRDRWGGTVLLFLRALCFARLLSLDSIVGWGAFSPFLLCAGGRSSERLAQFFLRVFLSFGISLLSTMPGGHPALWRLLFGIYGDADACRMRGSAACRCSFRLGARAGNCAFFHFSSRFSFCGTKARDSLAPSASTLIHCSEALNSAATLLSRAAGLERSFVSR